MPAGLSLLHVTASLFRKHSHTFSLQPLCRAPECLLWCCSLRNSTGVAGTGGFLRSEIMKLSQLAARTEASQWTSPVSTVKLEHRKSRLWPVSVISFPAFFSWPWFIRQWFQIRSRHCSSCHPVHVHSCLHFHSLHLHAAFCALLMPCLLPCLCFPDPHGSQLIHPTLTLPSSPEWQDCHFEEMEASRSWIT